MTTWLRQSTAVEVKLGPFVDATDGVTAETGLTISQADVRLAKNGGDWAQKNESTAAAHEENGWYRCLLDATDTNTLGILKLAIAESGALPVWEDFLVVNTALWDALFASSGGAIPNVVAGGAGGLLISGSNSGTTTLAALTVTGALTVGGGVAITNSTSNGHGIISTGNGTGSGLRVIGGATGIGLAALNGGGSAAAASFFNQGSGPALLLTGAGANAGLKSIGGSTGHGFEIAGGGTSGDGINITHTGGSNSDIDADINGVITTATNVTTVNGLAAGVITAAAIATDAIDADAIASSAVTEIQSGLSTLDAAGVRTAVGLASANLDTQLDALPTAAENAAALGARQITEGYAADGVAPTLDQALSMIWSGIGQFAISSTTLTCYKLDGTTASMTFTLDDATAPTSRTRAS